MFYRGNLTNKIKFAAALSMTFALFVFGAFDSFSQIRPKTSSARGRSTSPRIATLGNASTANLVANSVANNIKNTIDKYYPLFERCMLLESSGCGEKYSKCFDTTDSAMQALLTTTRENCFTNTFGADNENEEIKTQAFANLGIAIQTACTELNNRQVISGNGCKALLANQSPGYLRYKECVRTACVPMDGGNGNFTGCFGATQTDNLSDATSGCMQMLSTYSTSHADNMRKELMKEVRALEEKSCNRMMGSYVNTDLENPGGSCKVFVGYSRESSMTRKYTVGKTEFYAVTADGDYYETAPSSFPTYPPGVSNGDIKYFGRFENAKQYDAGANVFCSYDTFGMQRLYSYDGAADAQYGSAILSGGEQSFGMADMQLIMGAVGVIPGVVGLAQSKNQEGTAKLAAQTQSIDLIKDALKPLSTTVVGGVKVNTDGGKLRVGEELKGACTVQGGMSYRESETISIRWQ